jgi:hypothetical protein
MGKILKDPLGIEKSLAKVPLGEKWKKVLRRLARKYNKDQPNKGAKKKEEAQ